MNADFSEVKIVHLPRLRTARYVMISTAPERDAIIHMDNWAEKSGLLSYSGYEKCMIGWDFPFVSEEQSDIFGLRGYVCAYVIPDDFEPKCSGAEISHIAEGDYAVLTIADPHNDSLEKISNGFERMREFLEETGKMPTSWSGLQSFEEQYEQSGTTYMDIYVPIGLKDIEG